VGEGVQTRRYHRPHVSRSARLRGGSPRALADATVPQIATFTGHSLRDVEAILDAHYLGRDVQLAEIAGMKLETRTKL
jgi:hypothetical protein